MSEANRYAQSKDLSSPPIIHFIGSPVQLLDTVGSFDSATASLREAIAALRMTEETHIGFTPR